MKDSVWAIVAKSLGYPNMKTLLQTEYHGKNKSQDDLAALLGCSPPTLGSLLIYHKVPKKPVLARPKIQLRELKALSGADLARKYKISLSTAWRMRTEAGVSTHRHKARGRGAG